MFQFDFASLNVDGTALAALLDCNENHFIFIKNNYFFFIIKKTLNHRY